MGRTLLGVVPLAAVLALAACGGGSSRNGDNSNAGRYDTGADIERALSGQLTDKEGNRVLASCPNERVVEGETITCRVTFSDASYHDFTVTLTGFNPDGSVKIKLGVP